MSEPLRTMFTLECQTVIHPGMLQTRSPPNRHRGTEVLAAGPTNLNAAAGTHSEQYAKRATPANMYAKRGVVFVGRAASDPAKPAIPAEAGTRRAGISSFGRVPRFTTELCSPTIASGYQDNRSRTRLEKAQTSKGTVHLRFRAAALPACRAVQFTADL